MMDGRDIGILLLISIFTLQCMCN